MGILYQLDSALVPLHSVRRVPGPVRRLDATVHYNNSLTLRWERPHGGALVDGYRIERTREGRVFQRLGDTSAREFLIRNPRQGVPWFYRVTAFNAQGVGRAKLVFLYRRGRYSHPRKPVLHRLALPVPVMPGRRVEIIGVEPEA